MKGVLFMKKKVRHVVIKRLLIIIATVTVFILSPFFYPIRSYVVMSVYSYSHYKDSFLDQENIKVNMPGGLSTWQKDYYPFVMTFDASEAYARRTQRDVELMIYYNFGAFRWLKGNSSMFDPNSPYYNSFYGAYVVREDEGLTSFMYHEDGRLNVENIMDITDYDVKHLVLASFGDKSPTLEYVINQDKDESTTRIIDGREFRVIDATLIMDGMWHHYEQNYMSYIQYGKPLEKDGKGMDSFEPLTGYGRIYLYEDKKTGIGYILYAIATSEAVIEEVEKDYIQKTRFDLSEE